MVEFHYKNPPPLLPSLRDVLRCERVYREHGLPSVDSRTCENDIEKDLQELREANKKVHQLEIDLTEANSENNRNDKVSEETNETLTENVMMVKAVNLIENTTSMQIDEKTIEKIENETHLIDENESVNGHKKIDANPQDALICNENEPDKFKSMRCRKRNTSIRSFGDCDDLIELSEEVFKSKLQNGARCDTLTSDMIDEQLQGLDINLIKKLAFVQLQKIVKENPDVVDKYQTDDTNKAIKDALSEKLVRLKLPSQLLTKDDIARIAEQFNSSSSSNDDSLNDPAYAGVSKPIEPFPKFTEDCYIYSNGFEKISDDKKRALAIAQRLEKPLRESKIRARAVLTPVGDILAGKKWYTNSYTDNSIFMRYRNLIIGTGPNCDLQMKSVRKCARFSSHHATIFYDEVNDFWFFI